MIHEVNGDLITGLKYDIFCHQTNCMGVMGAGIAKQIAEAYPEAKKADQEYHRAIMDSTGAAEDMLGTIITVKTHDNRLCVNMYGQVGFGWARTCKTDYGALRKCMEALEMKLSEYDESYVVGFPYGIGCGLGGGDWKVVRSIIERFSKNIRQDVYIVRKVEAK